MRKTSKFVVAVLLGHIHVTDAIHPPNVGLPWNENLGFGW